MALTFNAIARAASFSPSQAFPLDARSYFESKDLAVAAALTAAEAGTKAASNTVYYIGQTLVVNEGSAATLYIIQPDKSLKEVGSVPVGDGKSIEVVDGEIKLKGFGAGYYKYNAEVEGKYEFVEGEFKAGLQPQIVSAAEGEGFEIAWYEPNPTTVEGLQSEITALSGSVNTLSSKLDNNYYTSQQIDNKGFVTIGEVDTHINKIITEAVDSDSLENLAQLVEYVNSHDTEIITDVANIEKQLSGIEVKDGAVKAYVDGAITSLNIGDYAKAQALSDLSKEVNEVVKPLAQGKQDPIVAGNGIAISGDKRTISADLGEGLSFAEGKIAINNDVKSVMTIVNGDVNTEGTLKYQLKQVRDAIPTDQDIIDLIAGQNYVTDSDINSFLKAEDFGQGLVLDDNSNKIIIDNTLVASKGDLDDVVERVDDIELVLDDLDNRYLKLEGGTLTGDLVLSGTFGLKKEDNANLIQYTTAYGIQIGNSSDKLLIAANERPSIHVVAADGGVVSQEVAYLSDIPTTVNVNQLVQTIGEELILNGGSAGKVTA